MMRPTQSGKIIPGTRRAWEPPAITKLAIGSETKSASGNGQLPSAQAASPQPPATPSTKLGFSLEMAFPLSARTEQ
jgi:hypothetical protein